MTDEQRDVLTFFLLIIVPYGIWRATHAAMSAHRIYTGLPEASARSVRDPLQIAKWLLVVVQVCVWFAVQGWIEPVEILRPFAFCAVAIGLVLMSWMLDRGYTRWWLQMRNYIEGRRRRLNEIDSLPPTPPPSAE